MGEDLKREDFRGQSDVRVDSYASWKKLLEYSGVFLNKINRPDGIPGEPLSSETMETGRKIDESEFMRLLTSTISLKHLSFSTT